MAGPGGLSALMDRTGTTAGRAAGFRRALVSASLVILIVAAWQGFNVGEFCERVRAFPRRASLPAWQASAEGTWFWFDRGYGSFLESVRQASPEGSTIALI